jgi:signal transduction histidine kinase
VPFRPQPNVRKLAIAGKGSGSGSGSGTNHGRAGPAEKIVAAARMEGVLRGSHDGFMALDAGWRITYVNEAGARILGKPHGEIIGKLGWAEFAATAGGNLEKSCRRALAEQIRVEFEVMFPRDDRWFAVKAYPISADELGVCFHEVTAKHRSEEKSAALRRYLETQVADLRQLLGEISRARDAAELASRAKDDFLGALAHEMRTPLSPILSFCSPPTRRRIRSCAGRCAKLSGPSPRTWPRKPG